MALSFRRNFPDLEIHKPTTEKSHVSNSLYEVYMSKTIICCTSMMSALVIASIHAWSPHVCVHVQECLRIHDPPQYLCTKNLVFKNS